MLITFCVTRIFYIDFRNTNNESLFTERILQVFVFNFEKTFFMTKLIM